MLPECISPVNYLVDKGTADYILAYWFLPFWMHHPIMYPMQSCKINVLFKLLKTVSIAFDGVFYGYIFLFFLFSVPLLFSYDNLFWSMLISPCAAEVSRSNRPCQHKHHENMFTWQTGVFNESFWVKVSALKHCQFPSQFLILRNLYYGMRSISRDV